MISVDFYDWFGSHVGFDAMARMFGFTDYDAMADAQARRLGYDSYEDLARDIEDDDDAP